MTDETGVRVVRDGDLAPGVATPGLTRETAFDVDGVLLSRTTLPAGFESDWHTHGDRGTYALVTAGELRLDHGEDGDDAVTARPGDVAVTPPGVVHRDVNPGETETAVVAAFVGPGEAVKNVGSPRRTAVPPEVVPGGETVDAQPVGGVVRSIPDESTPAVPVHEYVRPGRTTDWRHFGENDVFGYVRDGDGTVEWSETGDRRVGIGPGDFLRVSPGFTHRIAAGERGLSLFLWVVGPEPGAYPLDSPGR